jgi:hypothetical protein
MVDFLNDLGSAPLFKKFPDWKVNPNLSANYATDILQNQGGVAEIIENDIRIQQIYNCRFSSLGGKKEEYEILEHFKAVQGRTNRFWLPLPVNSLQPVANIAAGSTVLIFENSNFQFVEAERIFIYLVDGDILTFKVISTQIQAGNLEVEITTPIDRLIELFNFAFAGNLILCRFDQDSIEFNHPNSETSYLNLKFIELVQELDDV